MPAALQVASWVFRPLPFLHACRARFGPTFTVRFPSYPPMVFTSDPDVIRDVFAADPDTVHVREANRIVEPLLGSNSLLLLDGPRHRRERKLMLPPLHGERMRAHGATMRELTARAIERWPSGRAFQAHAELQRLTLEIILRTVFGVDDPARLARFHDAAVRLLGFTARPAAMLLTGPFGEQLATRLPSRRWNPVARFIALKLDVVGLLQHEIASRGARPDPDRADVLTLLLSARDEDGNGLSNAELLDELMTLLVAGHETTATALAWALYAVLRDPAVHARAEREARALHGGAPEVPYIDAVIKESLRLHTILPMVVRELRVPLQLGPLALPAGVMVAPNVYLTHRRADLWPEPERFRPERFLDATPRPHHYFPFGGGARTCLGMAFANYEMRIVLAEILRRAELALAPGYEARMVRRGITLAPSSGVPVVLQARMGRPAGPAGAEVAATHPSP